MSGADAHPLRVAVTGLGVVSAAGSNLDDFWKVLYAGHSVAAGIERIDLSESPIRFGCEVRGFEPTSVLSAKEARRLDRTTQVAIGAVEAAWLDAGSPEPDPDRVATVIGTGFGGLESAEQSARDFLGVTPGGAKGRVNPLFIPTSMPNAASANVAMRRGFRGPCLTITTACAAGANAIGEGLRMLRDGSADVVVAGGAEAPITPWIVSGFAAAHALSERSDDPEHASRPFDADRDGFVIGEGSAMLVLERLDDARARGATIRGELIGYGRNTDAFHLVAPSPDGRGASDCMLLAIADAGLSPGDIAHINAHGTSTPHNDAAEAAALGTVFPDGTPPVTSLKGTIGHAIGAAGAIEAVASLLTLEQQTIPPTANFERADPEIDLDVVTEPRALPAGAVLSTSFAFGGHNAVLVFARP